MEKPSKYLLSWALGALILGLAVLPLRFPDFFSQPITGPGMGTWLLRGALALLPLVAALLVFRRREDDDCPRLLPILLCLLAACFCEHIHHQFVDKGHYFGGQANSAWQLDVHRGILRLDPAIIPHSYRFLSSGLVAILEWLSGSFVYGLAIYRILFNTLLFATMFVYARLFLKPLAATALVLIMVMLYPVTIAWYAGQSLDPISHLSFMLCLIFLAKGQDAGLAPTLITGVLAKESVLIMALCRAFYGEKRWKSLLLSALYLILALASLLWIRAIVNQNSFAYNRISGVDTAHIWRNLRGYDEWLPQYLFSLGVLIPGAVLGWRLMSRSYQLTCAWVTFSLIASSALFSWLNEVRNLVPAMVLLAIINLKYLETRFAGAQRSSPPSS